MENANNENGPIDPPQEPPIQPITRPRRGFLSGQETIATNGIYAHRYPRMDEGQNFENYQYKNDKNQVTEEVIYYVSDFWSYGIVTYNCKESEIRMKFARRHLKLNFNPNAVGRDLWVLF